MLDLNQVAASRKERGFCATARRIFFWRADFFWHITRLASIYIPPKVKVCSKKKTAHVTHRILKNVVEAYSGLAGKTWLSMASNLASGISTVEVVFC